MSEDYGSIRDTALFKFLRNQRKKGKCPITLIVGETRSGKTMFALALAAALDPKFNMKKQLHFDILDFARAFAEEDNRDRVFILDEASVELDSASHSSIESKVFGRMNDTQAYRGTLVFIILPYATSLAKLHRKKVKPIVWISGRGVYNFYYASFWPANLKNDNDIRLELIETVNGGKAFLPPKKIQEEYINQFQDKFKKEILLSQINLLSEKRNKAKDKAEIISNLD